MYKQSCATAAVLIGAFAPGRARISDDFPLGAEFTVDGVDIDVKLVA